MNEIDFHNEHELLEASSILDHVRLSMPAVELMIRAIYCSLLSKGDLNPSFFNIVTESMVAEIAQDYLIKDILKLRIYELIIQHCSDFSVQIMALEKITELTKVQPDYIFSTYKRIFTTSNKHDIKNKIIAEISLLDIDASIKFTLFSDIALNNSNEMVRLIAIIAIWNLQNSGQIERDDARSLFELVAKKDTCKIILVQMEHYLE